MNIIPCLYNSVKRLAAVLASWLALCVCLHADTPPTNGLVLWLDASSLNLANGATVTGWNDSSGNGNNLSVSGTSLTGLTYVSSGINGAPAVQFNGSTFLYSNDLVPTSNAFTYVAVFTTTNTASAAGVASPGEPIVGQAYANNTEFGVSNGTLDLNTYSGGWNDTAGVTSVNNGSPQIAAVTFTSGGTASLYLNGQLDASTTTAPISFDGGYGFNRIGGGYGSSLFQGDIAEILVYNTALDSTQLGQVNSYLDAKYEAIPEPRTAGLFVLGGLGLALLVQRLRRKLDVNHG